MNDRAVLKLETVLPSNQSIIQFVRPARPRYMVTEQQFREFLTDANLALAIEASRRVDDVFDLIAPNENQHSRLLEWLLDPREGHGQGEAIFKDFLMAAHIANEEAGGRQRLLSKWTPGRIAVTGFQSLIVIREKAMTGTRKRQDLFLVDPVQKFIIVVENKAGTRWRPAQLKDYHSESRTLIAKSGPFREFDIGYVLLDRYKDEASIADSPDLRTWAYLDYLWLEKAARRAEARMERGLEAGQQLVISYCRRQAEYKSEQEQELDRLVSVIARDHRNVVSSLGDSSRRRHPAKDDRGVDTLTSQVWLWAAQNRDLTKRLSKQKILTHIERDLSDLGNGYEPRVQVRQQLFVADESWTKTLSGGNKAPLRIRVRQMKLQNEVEDSDEDPPRLYSLCLEYWQDEFAHERYRDWVKTILSAKYPEKEFQKYEGSKVRRLGLKKRIAESQIAGEAIGLYKELHGLISTNLAQLR